MSSKDGAREATEGRLAEYSALRAEIRHYLDRRETITHFALLVTGAATGLAASLADVSGYLFGVAALFIAVLWYDAIRSIRAVYRVSAYIRIVVESHLPGTLWETLGRHHKVHRQHMSRLIAGLVFPLTYGVNSALMAMKVPLNLWHGQVGLGGLTFIAILLVVANIRVHWNHCDREESEWKRLLAEYLPTEKPRTRRARG